MIHAGIKVYTNGVWALRTRATFGPGGLSKDKCGDREAGDPAKGTAVTAAWGHEGLWHAGGEASEGRQDWSSRPAPR